MALNACLLHFPDMMLRRMGQVFMAMGAVLGAGVALAIGTHTGIPGMPWLINVALAKLTLLGAGGMMMAGAAGIRFERLRETRRIAAGDDAARDGVTHLPPS